MSRYVDPIPALKQQAVREILLLLDGWEQAKAGALLCAWQPRVSELRAGHLHRFSLERLLRYLVRLGRDVELVSRRSSRPSVLDHRRLDGDVPQPRFSRRPPGPSGGDAR